MSAVSYSIEHALEQWAATEPDQPLLHTRAGSWSYGDILASARSIAARLHERGVRSGDRVVLSVSHKDDSFVAAYFGVHLAGAIAVPIDERASSLTRSAIEAQVEPALTLNRGELTALRNGACDSATMLPEPSPDAVADIMFTSGTTGAPKGVMLSHSALAAAASNINAFIGNGRDDREVVTVPLNHSFGLGRLRCTVLAGGTLILVPGLTFPGLTFDAMEAHHATGLACVPTGATVLLRTDRSRFEKCGDRLRYMELGSAPMPRDVKRALMQTLPRTRICMHYGLTEASRSAFIEFHADADALDSVGRPCPNVEIAIETDDGEPAPPDRSGRIMIRAASVMTGYWQDPGLTRDTLRGGEWLDTRDIGRLDGRGYLYLDGRRDDLINVGGKKVYPAAVEAAAIEHAAISDAACVGTEDPEGLLGEVVALFVVPREGVRPDEAEMRAFLTSRLDTHAVPRFVRFIDRLPRTQSGKLQRAALRNVTVSRDRNAPQPA